MTLPSGTRLGPYEITGAIGAGGMGEVYRATDTKLKREVAIKVLPQAFVEDKERLARFEREAQLLAQLHHPNIASIFGLEESGESPALVMELVEGATLADRLAKGPIPVEEALPIARQVAEALEYAHEHGIIHRDLKPANIKLSGDGEVKVLDFGLAKAMETGSGAEAGSGSVDLSHSPTMTLGGTVQGMILGTAGYMAPEQAAGKAVDKRADIWAFGVVLYEMLTGRRLFQGDSVPETLAGILKGEIDLDRLPDDTPSAIRRLLRRCLERNPKNRLRDIGDARLVIAEVLDGTDWDERNLAATAGVAVGSRGWGVWLVAAMMAVVVGIVGLVAGRLLWRGSPVAGPPMHLAIRLASNQELGSSGSTRFAFSPDGSMLVFAGSQDGHEELLRRRLGESETVAIPGTDEAQYPFFSPDGRWIGFAARNKLRKVPVDGGRPFALAGMSGAGGACWLSDGTIVFAPSYADGLFRIAADGGTPQRLTTPDHAAGVLGHWWPEPLPGERWILFTAYRTPMDTSRIGVVDLDTHKVRWLIDGGFDARYVATGHVLYAKGKRIYALPFDPVKAVATGPAVAVIDDVQTSQSTAYADYAVARNGTLAYATEALASPLSRLVWIDRHGGRTNVLDEARRFRSVSLSHDGRQAATTILGDNRDLWTVSFDRGVLSRLTTGGKAEFDPVWTADDKELIYTVDVPPYTPYRISVGAPDSGRPLWKDRVAEDSIEPRLSPDGRMVAFVRSESETGLDIFLRPLDGSAPARPFRATKASEQYPTFSPDGRWLAYESDESGRYEIYAERVDGSGGRVQVSANGGREPLWAADGEIFFRHDDEMRAVATRLGEKLELQPARTLFRVHTAFFPGEELRDYDVTQDGSRVIAIFTPEESRPRQIEVITNWMQQLPHLAPASGKSARHAE